MNKKKLLLALSISSFGVAALVAPLSLEHTFNSKAAVSKTVNILSLLKTALAGKEADVTPTRYSLYSESDDASYTFEVSNVFVNASNQLVIKRDGYIRNASAFNGLSILTFDFDGDSTGVDAIFGSYDEEHNLITMDARKMQSCVVINSTNFSLRNKDSNLDDQVLNKLSATYACTNGDIDNVLTESAVWAEEFDFYTPDQLGTEELPYLIETCAGMRALARVNNSGIDFTGKYFSLQHSLDFAGEGIDYVPVGTNGARFNGTFDGNNGMFTLNQTIEDVNGWGIFGNIGLSGIVKNFSVTGELRLSYASYVGAIAGESRGYISNTIDIVTYKGIDSDTISNCSFIGGLVGCLYSGKIYYSTAVATIKVDGSCAGVGGFLGCMINGATMDTIDAAGDLTAEDKTLMVGGYIGASYCLDSFNTVVSYYTKLNDSRLHYNFSDFIGEETVNLDFGTSNNRYHGRYIGYSTYAESE